MKVLVWSTNDGEGGHLIPLETNAMPPTHKLKIAIESILESYPKTRYINVYHEENCIRDFNNCCNYNVERNF